MRTGFCRLPEWHAGASNVFHKHREFISAHSGDCAVASYARPQPAAHFFNEGVPDGVAIAVIDDLEVVDVNEKDGSGLV